MGLREQEETEMTTQPTLEPIPQPPGYPFLGNLFDLDSEAPLQSLMKLAR